MDTKRIIVGLVVRGGTKFTVGEVLPDEMGDMYVGKQIVEIVPRRDGLADICSKAPEPFIYHVTAINDDDLGTPPIQLCIPFKEMTRVDYINVPIEKPKKDETPEPEAG